MAKETADPLLKEMQSIKMLLILQLLRDGAKQSDIVLMLGTSDATISRLIPKEVKAPLKDETMDREELKVLEDIRRLLIFILLKQGMKQGEVADALGVSQPTISRMFAKKAKKNDSEGS